MKDWVVATALGVVVVGVVFALPLLTTLLSVLLTPVLFVIAVTLGIWFLLQIFKDGDGSRGDSRNGGGPDP